MDYRTLDLLFRCGREFSHRKIRRQDLSDTECMICSYIFSRENCSQDDVSAALRVDKTTVGKALVSLEKKNCVVRRQDAADRRIKRIELTGAGREKVAELVDIHDSWLREVMTCLSEEEKAQFENLCGRLLAAAEKLEKNGGNRT